MKTFALGAGLIVMIGAAAVPAAAQSEQPVADRTDEWEALRASYQWAAQIDQKRLFEDKVYAGELLARLDAMPPLEGATPRVREMADAVRSFRLGALIGARRQEEAAQIVRGIMADGEAAPVSRAMGVLVHVVSSRMSDAIALVEDTRGLAARGTDMSAFNVGLQQDLVNILFRWAKREKGGEKDRLTVALAGLGWPGNSDRRAADTLRASAAMIRLKAGAMGEAERLAAAVSTPAVLAELLSKRSMDAVAGQGNPAERIAAAMAAEDEAGARGVEADMLDLNQVRTRVEFLRSAGRSEEAYELAAPYVEDMDLVRAFAADGDPSDIFWLVNEAAYALSDLNRGDEAAELLSELEGLGLEEHGELISMVINRLSLLRNSGRHADAAAAAVQLANTRANFASPYGRMWIWSNAACAYRQVGQVEEAAPWIGKVVAGSKENSSAHMQVLLCTGDRAAAEALMIERLQSDDPHTAIMALQDFKEIKRGTPTLEQIELARLKESPAVRAAFDKVAHRISLPMRRTYWGQY